MSNLERLDNKTINTHLGVLAIREAFVPLILLRFAPLITSALMSLLYEMFIYEKYLFFFNCIYLPEPVISIQCFPLFAGLFRLVLSVTLNEFFLL